MVSFVTEPACPPCVSMGSLQGLRFLSQNKNMRVKRVVSSGFVCMCESVSEVSSHLCPNTAGTGPCEPPRARV